MFVLGPIGFTLPWLLWGLVALPVLAQETTEEEAPEPIWKGSLGLAYLGTSGNSETSSFGLDFTTERRPTPWGLTITGKFNRNDDSGNLTAERYSLAGRARRAGPRRRSFDLISSPGCRPCACRRGSSGC